MALRILANVAHIGIFCKYIKFLCINDEVIFFQFSSLHHHVSYKAMYPLLLSFSLLKKVVFIDIAEEGQSYFEVKC